jgi:RNA polymerase sigma-70 factor (ECF subfamily)
MMQTIPDENILVEKAIQGNVDAFGDLYMLYQQPIYRYIYFRLADEQDAEDLTEVVFIKAWEALPGYRQLGYHFKSWLYRIAHNIVVDFHRQTQRQKQNQTVLYENLVATTEPLLAEIEKNEDLKKLAWAISQLSEDSQQVIVLRFIEGLGHKEIAEIMDKSEGNCRMIQHRALVTLNKLMLDEG